jgi:hypothetical protein
VTVSQKIVCSFLLSALLVAGIAFTGIFTHYRDIAGESAQISIFVAVFLTLFLIIFFCFNLRRDSAGELQNCPEHKESEDLETVEETPEHNADMKSVEDTMSAADFTSAEAVQVESVTGLGGGFFMFRQPFTFTPGNPELLQGAGNADIVSADIMSNADIMSEVVYEQDGIHYINNNVFADNERRDEFDNNFAKLVESVVNKIDT